MLLEYFKAKKLLEAHGIKSIESAYVFSAAEALSFSKGRPIVMKVISDKALHKSKAGLVMLNLSGKDQIEEAFKTLSRKGKSLGSYRIIAQLMSPGGIEMIIGGNEDPQFGKMVLIGLGGIYVEIFRDFSMMSCPIAKKDASVMVSSLKSSKIVAGSGQAEELLEDLLMRISRLLLANPEIKELDLNPVIIHKDSYDVVDIRMIT